MGRCEVCSRNLKVDTGLDLSKIEYILFFFLLSLFLTNHFTFGWGWGLCVSCVSFFGICLYVKQSSIAIIGGDSIRFN